MRPRGSEVAVRDLLGELEGCFRFLSGMGLPVGLCDASGSLRFANPAWTAAFGASAETPYGWLRHVSPDDVDHVRRTVESAIASHEPTETEFVVRTATDTAETMSCSLSPVATDEGEFAGVALVCQDVTERRRREQRLAFMAGHDPLTGLANRRAFEEELGRAVSRAGRGGRSVVLMLDMDHLKRYNDARGHLAGDQALVNLAMLLRTHVRAADLPARIGGDEFAVLLEDATLADATEIAERMGTAVRAEEFVDGAREFELGLSGGLVHVEPGCDPRTVMDRADVALYTAKTEGRHRMVVWTPDLGGSAASERLAVDLYAAITTGAGFTLEFQPVVRLDTGEVVYYESLARLTEPDGTRLLPGDFLPVVERLGLMGRLTRLVVNVVLARLAENPGISVSVNLSASDLTDPTAADEIERALASANVDPTRLVLELSESTVLSNLPTVRAFMSRLGALGCRFVLDDFGTALGAFTLLREIPADQVKLSHSVVRALSDSAPTRSFIAAVRELIESQGKIAVAAFVETDELLAGVREVGFRFGQGHRVHEPEADLTRLVAEMAERAVH